MNKQTGKLLVLGGFALRLCVSGINLLMTLIKYHFYGFFGTVIDLASIGATLIIVAGFGIMFLAGRDILDLIITGGFAAGLLSPIVSAIARRHALWTINASGELVIHSGSAINNLIIAINGLISLALIAAYLIWAFKLYRNSKQLEAFAVAGSIAASFFVALLTSMLRTSMIISLFSNMISVAAAAALAFAAFMEYQNDTN